MRNRRLGLVVPVLLAACGGSGGEGDDVADADVGDVDAAPADAEEPDAATCGAPITVFLNFGGGTYLDGDTDDASTNTSSFLEGDHTVPAYAGNVDVDALVACMRDLVAPFRIEITTTDPGAAAHREIAFVDGSESLGLQSGISNIAPFVCPTAGEDTTPRSIGFVFPDELDDDTASVCNATAQTLGYTFALDHAYHCPDVMSWLTACDDKSFVDRDVECGENASRPCRCGNETQNSYQRLTAVAGAACD